jgi:uncharacterized protein (TIGR01777 family)
MKHIVITGGTGFLGGAITRALLDRGDRVTIVSRGARPIPGCSVVGWDALQQAVDTADAVINLAGSSVGGPRWSAKVRHEILNSRLDATKRAVDAIKKAPHAPCLVSASAVGFYGNTMVPSNEAMGAGATFLAVVTDAWEREAVKASQDARVAIMRIGVVLDAAEGALPKMVTPMKMFVGGVLGSGRQWLPWVHVQDVVSAFLWAVDNEEAYGVINLVAPEAVTMKTFTTALASVMGRPSWLPVPALALRLLLGQQADVVLHGQHVVPNRLLGSNFTFAFPSLRKALGHLLSVR